MKYTKTITNEEQLNIAFDIRKEVFVKEQGVPLEDEFDEFDQLDDRCGHILVYYNNQAVGTGRLRIVDEYGKLERICLLEEFRKLGLGKVIVQALEEIAKEIGVTKVKLHGQTHAEGFYQNLGYETASDVFMEDGIPHVLMTKQLN
ncbi:GNAT family N-acetyltransferase [Ureibacillus acetophenoni]|uniref:Predicted GNAT family N-acyltransferase n=1 Tax=Ureibacillus acetophenoni TaxID=614649 RepID=A0A285ULL4_9BACL|nr:GNAT family N-acetyltransferase [Ureibacillus acetophenoni]SOC42785.1 predicted GNAT family N-acyltransferase [Ureibacillus acetophenoni]